MEKYSLDELKAYKRSLYKHLKKYYENYLRYLKKYYDNNLTKSLSRKL